MSKCIYLAIAAFSWQSRVPSMLKYVYLAIVAFVLVLITVNMFRKKDKFFFQLDAAIVMVTLLLRLLLIK